MSWIDPIKPMAPIEIGVEKQLNRDLMRMAVATEMKLIENVLRAFLERDPTNDDGDRCSQKVLTEDSYMLSYISGTTKPYERVTLGVIRYENKPDSFRVVYIPIEKYMRENPGYKPNS